MLAAGVNLLIRTKLQKEDQDLKSYNTQYQYSLCRRLEAKTT